MKKLLLVLSLLQPAFAGELLYTGKEFNLTIPAYDVTTITVPCDVTSLSYPKEKLQFRKVKEGDRTIIYLLPKEEKSVVSLSCVDRTYVFKLNPVDTRPKKKLVCKEGKCQIVTAKPRVSFLELDTNYVVVDPTVVREETKKSRSSFSSKEELIDEAVRLMSAMVDDKKIPGYVVRKKKFSYMLTPDLKVSLVRFYKGHLLGQVVKLTNESYFPVSFSVKELDGNGNVLLYSPSMDKQGTIHFAPKGEAFLYVVQVRNSLKLPFVEEKNGR